MKLAESEVREIFRNGGVNEQILTKLKPKTSLLDAGLDSLDIANLLLLIEEKYKVKIPDEEALEMDSLQSIVDLVNAKLS